MNFDINKDKIRPANQPAISRRCSIVFGAVLLFLALSFLSCCSRQENESRAGALYREASKLAQTGRTIKALEIAEKAAKLNPDHIENQLLLSRLYMDNGKAARAESSLDRVLRLKPGDVRALAMKITLLGDRGDLNGIEKAAKKILENPGGDPEIQKKALVALGDAAFLRDHDYGKAEEYFNRARAFFPEDPHLLIHLADIAIARQQYDKFHEILLEAEKRKDLLDRDGLVNLYNWLGDSYVFPGRKKEALESYQKALKLDPGNVYARAHMAYIYLDWFDLENADRILGNLPETHPDEVYVSSAACRLWICENRFHRAVRTLDNITRGKNFEPNVFWALGNLYMELGQYEQAEKIYRKYAVGQPLSVEAHLGLALCALAKGDEKGAEKIFKKWAPRLPGNSRHEEYRLKGALYVHNLNNLKKAEENLELYLKNSKPDDPGALMLMGYLRLLQKREKEAGDFFNRALANSRPEYYARLEVAELYAKSGYADRVMEQVNAAGREIEKLTPSVSAAMYYRCAYTLYVAGKLKDALHYAELSIQKDPDLTESLILLSRLYRETGEKEKAKAALSRALKLEPYNELAVFERDHPDKPNPYFYF
ncbi:MAG: tetratricopeptide repeat protein [Chloroflexi bacterium]|nr:tetratricopeptide repeat protein [Chloroflexota bacterium]